MGRRRRAVHKRQEGKGSVPGKDTRATLTCGFCHGTGKDPWGIPSILSACQVCLGRGTIRVTEPVRACALCHGSGVHLRSRLTCLACGGKGQVTIPELAEPCPTCRGQGRDHFGLYCLSCRGRGVVSAKGVA